MKKLVKNSGNYYIKKNIVFLTYIIINFILVILKNNNFGLLFCTNDLAIGYAIFCETTMPFFAILCFFVLEIILIISLFIKKCKFRLITNIIFVILCFIDIYLCTNSLGIQQNIEIILDLIFILLITFDIIKTYKKPKNDTKTIPK